MCKKRVMVDCTDIFSTQYAESLLRCEMKVFLHAAIGCIKKLVDRASAD